MKKHFVFFVFLLILTIFFSPGNGNSQEPPSTERTRNYDLSHLTIKVDLDLAGKTVKGNVTNRIIPLYDTLTVVAFDAVGFNINYVKDRYGDNQDYTYNGEKIYIKLKDKVRVSDTLHFEIDYECQPQRGLYFVYPTGLNPELNYQIWTQGQAEDNRHWIAIYDYPDDKTTSEVYITVDENFKTLSNGYLASGKISGTGKRTDHWIMDMPHSTYLIMLAAGDYNIINDNSEDVPIQSYTAINDTKTGEYSFRNTAGMLRFFNRIFGYEYPWNKYAQIVVDEFVYGGMENTTATVLNRRALYSPEIENDYSSDGLISHELAHQWWGDLTTCKNWDEMWLNESFATFATDLWWEEYYGRDEYDYKILLQADEAMDAQQKKGKFPIFGGKLTENTYSKGAVTLNTFRHLLGDEHFFSGLTGFLKNNEFKNVETKDLIQAFDRVYNYDLPAGRNPDESLWSWMFDQWIYKAGYPKFEVDYNYNSTGKEVILNVRQVQNIDSITPVFKAPLMVKIKSSNEEKDELINISNVHDVFRIKLNSPPEMVIFDYGNRIMDSLRFDKPKADWLMQVSESRNAIDRVMGVRGLNDYSQDEDVLLFLENLMMNDPYWGVKQEAAYVIGKSKTSTGKEILMRNYDKIFNSRIKRAVLKSFSFMNDRGDAEFILGKIKNEKNNYIVAEGIGTLGKILPASEIYDNVINFSTIESHRHVVKNAVIAALKTASLNSGDKRIKAALLGLAFGIGIDSRTRAAAIDALSIYAGDEDVKMTAMENIDYNFRYVRSALIKLIGESQDDQMITFLERLESKTTDSSMKNSIRSAIKKLSGS